MSGSRQAQTGLDPIHLALPMRRTPITLFSTPREKPVLYPGTRPTWSYCFVGEDILPLGVRDGRLQLMPEDDDWRDLASFLKEVTSIPLRERYAVLAVGSNACPARLADEDKYGLFERVAIPVIRGAIANVLSVYVARRASYGSVPATITGALGAQTELWVTLLTATELKQMDETEGRGQRYSLIELSGSRFHIGEGLSLGPVSAYFEPRGLADKDCDGPIRLDCFESTGSRFPAMSQAEVQRYVEHAATKQGSGELPTVQLRVPDQAKNLGNSMLPAVTVGIVP